MGLDQYATVCSKNGKQRKFEWRNEHELHEKISESWRKKGRPGRNAHGQENPPSLEDMGIQLELDDITSLKENELYAEFFATAFKALSTGGVVIYAVS